MKTAFIICPISDPGTEIRARADKVLRHLIRPAVESRGYRAMRADEIAAPGLITSQIIQHLLNDELVIADLTDRNPNVFYELAIRHAVKKPFIQIIESSHAIPFDLANLRTTKFLHTDLDSVETAKADIIKQIDEIEKEGFSAQSPISQAIDLAVIGETSQILETNLADILVELASMRNDMLRLGRKLENLRSKYDGPGHLHRIDDIIQELKNIQMLGLSADVADQQDNPTMPRTLPGTRKGFP